MVVPGAHVFDGKPDGYRCHYTNEDDVCYVFSVPESGHTWKDFDSC